MLINEQTYNLSLNVKQRMTKGKKGEKWGADLKPASFKLPKWQIDKLDQLVRDEKYANRSEIIRLAIRDVIKDSEGKY